MRAFPFARSNHLSQRLLQRFLDRGRKIFLLDNLFVRLKDTRSARQLIQCHRAREFELFGQAIEFARIRFRQRDVQMHPGRQLAFARVQ